jgi:hypothetical protein
VATRSAAALVGIDRATPARPRAYPGATVALAASTASESEGVTKKRRPRIMLRSPSPSLARRSRGRLAPQLGDQVGRVGEVGVGVAAAEVGERRAVDHRAARRAEPPLEDLHRVRPRDGVHRVEAEPERRPAVGAGDEPPDRREVEQPLHERRVVGHRVDHLDRHGPHGVRAQRVERRVGRVERAVLGEGARARGHRVGERLGRGAAVAEVVLDAEVAVRAARVVARRQDEAAGRAARADHARGGRRRQDAAAPHDQPPRAGRRGHAQDDLRGLAVEEPSVAAHHERRAGRERGTSSTACTKFSR